jgi:hypothetical protein
MYEFKPSSSIDDALIREKLASNPEINPYSNNRRKVDKMGRALKVPKEIVDEDKNIVGSPKTPREASIARRKARAQWFLENLPPLEFLSLTFSTYLCSLIFAGHMGWIEIFLMTRLMTYGGVFYFSADSIIEIFVLDRWTYIAHHIVAFVSFWVIYHSEEYGYTADTLHRYMPTLGWFEISTILLNIRSLNRHYVLHHKPRSNSLAEATFSEGSIGEDADRVASEIPKGQNVVNLKTELFFILSYGGIRLLYIPLWIITVLDWKDPLFYLSWVFVAMSASWVYEWIVATSKRYGSAADAASLKKKE